MTACVKCNGTGWNWNKAKDAVIRCECTKTIIDPLSRAGVPIRYRGIIDYDPMGNASRAAARDTIKKFVKNYPNEKGLMLCGPPGTGKTHLICYAAGLLVKSGIDVNYVDYNDFSSAMGSGLTYEHRDYEGAIDLKNTMKYCGTLLIDELGSTMVSQWVYDGLYDIINYRYNNLKPIICASNYSFEPPPGKESISARVGVRITSRLAETVDIISISGPDIRLIKSS